MLEEGTIVFDEDEFDCDCGGDEGEHYGCFRNECCEDCPYLFECDGCGNLIYRSEANGRRSPFSREKAAQSAPQEKKESGKQKTPDKNSSKKNTAITIGVLFLIGCLLLSLFL